MADYDSDYWSPGPKYQAYLERIDGILSTGEKRTVRDVYYALEARGFPAELRDINPDWEFEYRYVKRCVKKGRRAGFIDPGQIYDASRPAETVVDPGHDGPTSFIQKHIDGVWNAYEENFWADQDHYVEVWLEKQSLASVFEPICDELNVRLEATRGDWSDSKVYEATQRLRDRLRDGDDVRILYWGDFNPSGLHAPVSIQETMGHYGITDLRPNATTPRDYFDIWPWEDPAEWVHGGGTLEFIRQGLNLEHIKRFDLPENPTPSSTDKDRQLRERFMEHASDGRDVNIELNALKEFEREFLETTLREGIEQFIDTETRDETTERIKGRRAAIASAVSVDYSEVEDA